MNLLHLVVRGWRQRPGRTLLSILSVAIAIASVLGTSLSQSSVRHGMRELSRAVDKHPAVEIVSAAGGRFPQAELPDFSQTPGVAGAVPVVSRATLARLRGQRFRTVVVGLPLDSQAAWRALELSSGRAPQGANEAVLDAAVAKNLKAEPGDRVTIIARPPRTVTVVGIADGSALSAFGPAASLALPIETVQSLFGLPGQVDRARLLLASADDREAVTAQVTPRLPTELAIQTAASPTETIDGTLRSTELALKLAGALSLAMAAFIILNTLRLNFSERRRDFAVVRVLGTTRRQLVEVLLAEGVALGTLGSVVGIPLGMLLGRGLEQVLAALLGVPARSPQLSAGLLVTIALVGPLLAALAALVPAFQARGISAGEALSEGELRRGERVPWWAAALGIAAWCCAVLLVSLVVRQVLPPEGAIPAGILMLLAFVVVIPAVVPPIVRAASWLLSPVLRTEGHLAAQQLLARSTRTGLTVGVLVVALSSGLGLGSAIINNVDDVRGWYRRSLSGDVFITNPAAADESTAGSSGEPLGERIAGIDGVERAVQIRLLSAKAEGQPAMCIVRDFAPEVELPWVLSAAEDAALRARLKAGEAAVSGVLAHSLGLAVGDEFRMEVQGRVLSRRVAALVNDYMLGGRVAYLDLTAAEADLNLGPPYFVIVKAAAGTDGDQLAARLEHQLQGEGLMVQSFAEMRRQLDALIDGVVGALWGLLAVGFFVGGMAVSNTLTLNVLEQTRELGLLRIIGMTPGQARRLVYCESLLLGLLGALLGTLGGLTTAVVIHVCNEPVLGRAIPWHIPVWLLAANAGGCLLIALVAAWRPGVWATKLNVLSAIAHD